MPVQVTTDIKLKPLKAFINGLGKPIGVKVGVLGNKDNRNDGDPLGNAGIGLVQEVGSITNKIPARSFLRMPLETKRDRLQATFEKTGVKKKLLEGNVKGAMQDLGFVAEEIIDDAFKSSGFGNWAKNAPSTVIRKGSSKPLIDTSQLRPSITSEVVEKK
jgi:hypothetical protein